MILDRRRMLFGTAVCFLAAALSLSPPSANAWSTPGTKERAAEDAAAAKMRAQYPAYSIFACQMRDNKLSIAIATRNAIGKQVNFKCDVRKVTNRDGSWKYEIGNPQFVQ